VAESATEGGVPRRRGRLVAGGKLLRHKEEGENGEEWFGPKLDDLPMALTMKGGKCGDNGT
jgi:hypothetical protein